MQQGKFKQFKAFWNEKEQELKEIDFQLQKVSKLPHPLHFSIFHSTMYDIYLILSPL